jgi:hypothetical protein
MGKPLSQAAGKKMSLANTFQPQTAGRLVNKTYRPAGIVHVPKVVPPLISGAARPVPPSSNSAQGTQK